MTLSAAPPAPVVRTLVSRTPFYALYKESYLMPPARIERANGHQSEIFQVPGIEFRYAIRRVSTGQVVFRYEHERAAREALYELSALAGGSEWNG